jgi:hypothetical protein
MEINGNKKNEFYIPIYECKKCDFKCSYSSDWARHCSTRKHERKQMEMERKEKTRDNICVCGRSYATNSGLWKHQKKCPQNNNIDILKENGYKVTTDMFYELLAQNKELQQKIIEISTQKQPPIYSNCGNNNNNTFNLQIYLNETCKDALNINEFVDQIQLSISDLEETGKLGYSEGISRVFINNLNNVLITNRPIHCCDFKRETIYIKESNQWHKEDKDKKILTKAIKQVANKNILKIQEWQQLHPEYKNPDSKQSDKYMQIVLNSMSGSTEEEAANNYQKIIKNVAKNTIIDKRGN